MTKSQVFFWLLIAFSAGVALASYVPLGLTGASAIFGFGGAIAAFGLLGANRGRLVVWGLAISVLAAGMLRFIQSSRPPPSFLAEAGGRVAIAGVVDDDPERRSKSQQLIIRREPEGDRVLVISRPFPVYAYGDRLRIEGRLERPENFSSDFDYAAYLARDDIFFLMRFPEVELLGRGGGSAFYRFLFGLKERFAGHLERALPEPQAAFLSGLILGERQDFPETLTDQLRRSGTSHLVALSGYNITIVGDALLTGLMFVFVPFRWAFWLAVSGIVGFVALTGASASVVRAAIMGGLVLVARREGRLYRMRNALAVAACAMLVANPKVLRFDVGFQLSFLATLGIVYGAPMVEHWYERMKIRIFLPLRDIGLLRPAFNRTPVRHRSLLRDTLIATLSAQLAVLPLLVYYFGSLSLVSPLANLAVIPAIPLTMLFGFVAGVLGFLSEAAARIAAVPVWALLTYELSAVGFFGRLPFSALDVPAAGYAFLVGGYALVGYALWRFHRHRADRETAPVAEQAA